MDYLLFIQNIRQISAGFLDDFFLLLTRLAESPIPFIFLAYEYWCVEKRVGQLMALGTGINCAAGQIIKELFHIERPWIRDARIDPVPGALNTAVGYSFPSGHTIRSGSALIGFCIDLIRKKQKQAGVAALFLFLLIAFSRNYLGVHTPEDVFFGTVICVLNYFVLDMLLKWIDNGKNRDFIVLLSVCLLVIIAVMKYGFLSNCGSCLGFFIGWMIERRFIHFKMPESVEQKIERSIYGFLAIILISTSFQRLFSVLPVKLAGFLTSFFLASFIMAVYPAICMFRRKTMKKSIGVFLFILPLFIFGLQVAKAADRIAVIGHRGFAGGAPENTIPAFEAALALNVDYIELDVQLSSDGQVVVCHDANLQRVAGVDADLSSLTLEELKNLDVGSFYSPDFAGTQIPTLAEVLELVKDSDVRLYLELKDIGDDSFFTYDVFHLVQANQMLERCVFASFKYDYLRELKEYDQEVKVLFNTDISSVSLPLDYPAEYYGIKYSSFSAELANAIHQNGSSAFVWTVDDKQQMEEAVKLGADGICSNYPNLVQEYLNTL